MLWFNLLAMQSRFYVYNIGFIVQSFSIPIKFHKTATTKKATIVCKYLLFWQMLDFGYVSRDVLPQKTEIIVKI